MRLSSINSDINIIDLKATRIRNSIFGLRKVIKENKYNILWANAYPLTIIAGIASFLLDTNLYFTDHTNLNISLTKRQRWIASMLIKFFYKTSEGNSVVSKGLIKENAKLSSLNEKYFKCIYNPSSVGHKPTAVSNVKVREIWGDDKCLKLLAVGKLKPAKNHMMLLKAVNIIKEKNIRLIIVGKGELKNQLQDYIDKNKINHLVKLFGFTNDVTPFYNSADIFVHTSLWEGFGNVLVEALEFGLPIISTDCPHGPREILDHGKYGTLIEMNDHNELSKQITLLEKNLSYFKKKSYIQNQISRAKFFDIEKISNEYISWFKL